MTLVFLGNSALRRVSKSVADVRAPAVRRLFEELEKEVRVEAGVGIAAPQLAHNLQATTRDFEGCLSVPGYQGIVRRANMIRVQYDDLKGRKIQKTLNDFPARIFQHELDHLNGVMYLDRMEVGSLIHNEEFEAMEWLDVQKLLLQDPPAIPPLVNATNE
ncbi:peptide deformylase [Plasmopara halstedii]|uniref:Peptide deformylase n=1 Tax=Plasmopara halstedii TaxID=4781 RepID=A0A0P1A8T4_PLAHL|nr:peptide deformylase [Plasmopara halstedii]CEG36725.1 peptide deformylase [Plasmopara halstedii]|eukprot:XP_024573094.1 peptide deformylase [Plasmopara halstedii]